MEVAFKRFFAHMKIRNILFLLLGVGLLACSRHSEFRQGLAEAEALMVEHPDSALALLQRMDSAALAGDRECRALHALLLSQAMDKNYMDTADDSLISLAVQYYENSRDVRHRMLAHYYHGRILYNAEQYPRSLIATLQAMQDAETLDDKFRLAMSARAISDIYNTTYHAPEAIRYAKLAIDNFKASGHHVHHLWAMADIAISYNNNGDYDSSMVIARELMDSAINNNNATLQRMALGLIGSSYFGRDKYAEAIPYYIKLCADSKNATAEDSAHLAILYINNQQPQEAQQLLDAIADKEARASQWMLYEIYSKTGETEKELASLRAERKIMNQKFHDIIRMNMTGTLTDYNQAQELKRKTKLRTMQFVLVALVLVILTITLATLLYISRQRVKTEQHIIMARDLYADLEAARKANTETQSHLRNAMKTRFASLTTLLAAYQGLSTQEATKQKIVAELDKLINEYSITGTRYKELEAEVNATAGNLMANLRKDMPRHKEIDYILYLYSALGFTNSVLVMFLQVKDIQVIYNRKKRIREKLKELPVELGNYYLSFLN